jgi:hypothetical protein
MVSESFGPEGEMSLDNRHVDGIVFRQSMEKRVFFRRVQGFVEG